MSYEILEVHAVYEENKLKQLAVLWLSNEEHQWVRATYCINTPCSGYGYLLPDQKLSEDTVQMVAGYGMNLPDALKKKFFPGKRKWDR